MENNSKPKRLEQSQNPLRRIGVKQRNIARVKDVDRDANGDGFAVANLKIGKLLKLVRRPMSEIERSRGAGFKRIAAVGDMLDMEFGAALDHPSHGRRLKTGEQGGVLFQGFQKTRGRESAPL